MPDIAPVRNLPDAAEPWGRYIDGAVTNLRSAIDLLAQRTGNSSGALNTSYDSLASQLKSLADLTVGLAQTVADLSASGATWYGPVDTTGTVAAGTVTSSGNVSAGGGGDFASSLKSAGAAGTDLSTVSGLRQNAWQMYTGGSTGLYGYAPSTIASKANLSERLPFTAADIYAVTPYVYEYIGQVAIRDDPDNPEYDPKYDVPMEIGLVAEHLIAHNMSIFVVFNEDGSPKTIDYATFGAVAALVAARDLNARLMKAGL